MVANIEPNTPIERITRISPLQKKALAKVGLKTAQDLLYYFPNRYDTPLSIKFIETLQGGDEATLFGRLTSIKTGKTFRGRVPISEGVFEDTTGKIKLLWFNQPYIAKMFKSGESVRIEGKVSIRKETLAILNPKIEKIKDVPIGVGASLFTNKETGEEEHTLYPIYPETRFITSNWVYHTLQRILSSEMLQNIQDPIPQEILKKYNLPSLRSALIWIHAPQKIENAEVARKRFAFQEIFLIQLDRAKERFLSRKTVGFKIEKTLKDVAPFIETFPFALTKAQKRVADTILTDFNKGFPMSRLIEGDVGSGKTAVAAIASFAVVNTPPADRQFGNLQVAYMAPTEILAEQHFETFIQYFSKYKIKVGLITGSGAKKFPSKVTRSSSEGKVEEFTKISKPQLLKWVENGEIPILIGTHALIQKSVRFRNLGLIIIDEQHRFGIKQRMALRRKPDIAPHLISMTATPIPRTLALSIFGDLDLSLLDELPAGRKPVITKVALPHERESAYEFTRNQIKDGRQAYVICPRINEPDPEKETAINARSVKEEAERLQKKVFPEFRIGTLTGKDSPKEKEEKMRKFKEGKIDILVATSVVEVGVNVPNATVILIENAERFGLAQLHQLRGRVIRSNHQAYCYIFPALPQRSLGEGGTKSEKTISRLKSFINAKNGFELAEADLEQRGAGSLGANGKQWGVSDIAMEALRNIKMVEMARNEASALIEKDFDLKTYPLLANLLSEKSAIHLE